jgi:hypothetical protein
MSPAALAILAAILLLPCLAAADDNTVGGIRFGYGESATLNNAGTGSGFTIGLYGRNTSSDSHFFQYGLDYWGFSGDSVLGKYDQSITNLSIEAGLGNNGKTSQGFYGTAGIGAGYEKLTHKDKGYSFGDKDDFAFFGKLGLGYAANKFDIEASYNLPFSGDVIESWWGLTLGIRN